MYQSQSGSAPSGDNFVIGLGMESPSMISTHGTHAVLGAELQHFLSFGNTTNLRPRNNLVSVNHCSHGDHHRVLG